MKNRNEIIQFVFTTDKNFPLEYYDIENYNLGIKDSPPWKDDFTDQEEQKFIKQFDIMVNDYKKKGYEAVGVDGFVYATKKEYLPLFGGKIY